MHDMTSPFMFVTHTMKKDKGKYKVYNLGTTASVIRTTLRGALDRGAYDLRTEELSSGGAQASGING